MAWSILNTLPRNLSLIGRCRHLSSLHDAPNPIPASFLRGGTSKGIFLNRATLPSDTTKWDRVFLGIMGSPDPEHARQLNGMGGGVSSLSKICVVGAPSPARKAQGIEAEYTFVQVGIKDASIDLSGNCGNLSSVVGVFAVDEGICVPRTSLGGTRATVRLYNTNTQKIIDTTFPVCPSTTTPILDLPETTLAGVPGKASSILLEVLNPAGARTGKLLPTGSPLDTLTLTLPPGASSTSESQPPQQKNIQLSCIDATNPTIFVSSPELSAFLPGLAAYTAHPSSSSSSSPSSGHVSSILELIRRSGASKMGLDPSAQAQPKLALLSAPHTDDDLTAGVDLVIHALSMGVPHRAVPITVGLCAGVAAKVEGTLPWRIVQESRAGRSLKRDDDDEMVRMRHPSGVVDVGARVGEDGTVESARVVRTGRRLMRGVVWW